MDKTEAKTVFKKIDNDYIENLIRQNEALKEKTTELEETNKELLKEIKKDPEPEIKIDVIEKKLVVKFKKPIDHMVFDKGGILELYNTIMPLMDKVE